MSFKEAEEQGWTKAYFALSDPEAKHMLNLIGDKKWPEGPQGAGR